VKESANIFRRLYGNFAKLCRPIMTVQSLQQSADTFFIEIKSECLREFSVK
jgi:hypothetical protein